MKLYHRTYYWGSKLKAQQRNSHCAQRLFGPYEFFECQAVADDSTGMIYRRFSGCCPHRGDRVVEVRDEQIKAAYEGDWELYHTRTCLGKESYFHHFILIPKPQVTYKGKGWTHIGSVDGCKALDELERIFRPFQEGSYDKFDKENVAAAVDRHVHLSLVMPTLSEVHGKYSPSKSYISRRPKANNEKKLDEKSIRVTVV